MPFVYTLATWSHAIWQSQPCFWALFIKALRALSVVMVLTALVQILDAAIDCFERRWTLVPGVLILGVLLFVGASRISPAAFAKNRFLADSSWL